MARHLPLLALPFVLTTGCRSPVAAPVVDASLTTDKSAYLATVVGTPPDGHYEITVVARFANQGASPIYLGTCPRFTVHPARSDTTRSAFDPVFIACDPGPERAPLLVAAGEIRVDTLAIDGPQGWTASGAPIGTLSGPVTLVYDAATCSTFSGCPVPPAFSTSNVFTIDIPH